MVDPLAYTELAEVRFLHGPFSLYKLLNIREAEENKDDKKF